MKKYGILAYPAGHSLSPALHNNAFAFAGIKARYDFFEIPKEELHIFISRVISEPISGFSVSLPYKEKIIEYLHEMEQEALEIGAVNTVKNVKGVLKGYNTDYIGVVKAIKSRIPRLKGKDAILIGAGGSARAITYGLLREGVNVYIFNRTRAKAVSMAIEFAEKFPAEVHGEDINSLYTGDILINASSFWHENLHINDTQLPQWCNYEYLEQFRVVMDISYNLKMPHFDETRYDPFLTPLLSKAIEVEVPIITGESMLIYQALEQFKIWTGRSVPYEVMSDAVTEYFRAC